VDIMAVGVVEQTLLVVQANQLAQIWAVVVVRDTSAQSLEQIQHMLVVEEVVIKEHTQHLLVHRVVLVVVVEETQDRLVKLDRVHPIQAVVEVVLERLVNQLVMVALVL
jgi:hypothetical protein